ncbi:MAG: hypothetical protein A2Y98_03860 [Candidatus Portnoybacteria bacterium RBG_19FT_COMBO_36_7]|uniref:Uncharacterized protein n=1 Tax=Candidatus Portnoybacteria bacterium RBG_19FT_COMBO_36_7 TaxID=1801992 RepID=A0A1G2F8N1_9BACT|nr:MAG: hypothetical protein A2Y98_03860 [Candidatus Portnoybacteria bacterium RBG_19FT_COMBO_36_7]
MKEPTHLYGFINYNISNLSCQRLKGTSRYGLAFIPALESAGISARVLKKSGARRIFNSFKEKKILLEAFCFLRASGGVRQVKQFLLKKFRVWLYKYTRETYEARLILLWTILGSNQQPLQPAPLDFLWAV